MEVHLRPEMQDKLNRLADARGSDAETLASEAIERLVDYEEWFIKEVDKGLAQIDRGEVLNHREVGVRLQRRLAEKKSLA